MPAAPRSETELIQWALALAGRTLGAVAEEVGASLPRDQRRAKGKVGELLELALGASAGSLPEPDFQAIGVELKTIPVDARGCPRETTYVCTVPLLGHTGEAWEMSLVRRKLARVLWVPIEADPDICLESRRIGTPLLWSPTAGQELVLRRDWEELMQMVSLGELDRISARHGEYLQIRPKAASGSSLREAIGSEGERIQTLPRGFYLRSGFTRQILAQHYLQETAGHGLNWPRKST